MRFQNFRVRVELRSHIPVNFGRQNSEIEIFLLVCMGPWEHGSIASKSQISFVHIFGLSALAGNLELVWWGLDAGQKYAPCLQFPETVCVEKMALSRNARCDIVLSACRVLRAVWLVKTKKIVSLSLQTNCALCLVALTTTK